MASEISQRVQLFHEIAASVEDWQRTAAGEEARLIAEGETDESLFSPFETLTLPLQLIRTATQTAAVEAISENDLARTAVLKQHIDEAFLVRPFLPTEELISALSALAQLLADTHAQSGAPGDILLGGSLHVDDLRDELARIISNSDWQEMETAVGVRIPQSVRERPIEIDTHQDAFDGAATLSVEYAPWASPVVRDGLKTILEQHWLPAVREKNGEHAVGDRQTEEKPPEATVCRILFGTNRKRVGDKFTADCSRDAMPLSYGEALVSVPAKRKRGDIPRPWRVLGIEFREDANKHIMLVGAPAVLSRDEFVSKIRSEETPAALLFVHGFNTPFEGGLRRTAQIATDLDVEGPVLHYAWPSGGKPWLYDFDSENVKASRSHFKNFVLSILEAGIVQLNIVAHSKGNELVLEAFAELATENQHQQIAQHLILASPDVDLDVAIDRLKTVPSQFKSVTLYANAFDRPLMLSGGKANRPRIGGELPDHHPFIAPGVDTIDAANTNFEWFGFNHDAYVDAPILMYDLEALLKRGTRPPNERSPIIRPKDCNRGRYYKIVTE